MFNLVSTSFGMRVEASLPMKKLEFNPAEPSNSGDFSGFFGPEKIRYSVDELEPQLVGQSPN